jgi:exopolysaccharide production protein ExoQ
MVLIVFTEPQPIAAFKRLLSRVGFVLLPASVLLIRYYPALGTGWDPWGETQQFVGVTTNKNVLGNLVYLIGLGALWQILSLARDKEEPNRGRRLLAQCTVPAFGIYLLRTAHCATATACFIFGVGLMLALSLPLLRRSPAAVQAFVLTLALVGGVGYLLGAKAAVTEALGRKPDLTGRTEIWKIVIEMAPNPVGGAGFETFWVGPRVAQAYALIGGLERTNEAHNGYIEVYLNLGVLGLGLIVMIIGQGYLKAVSLFRRDPAFGGLLVAYVVTAAAYNVTEAGFRMLSLEWFFLLLSVVAANRVISVGETASESGREFARADGPLWATRMSSNSARLGERVETAFSRDAVTRWSEGREPQMTQIIADTRKANNRSKSRG